MISASIVKELSVKVKISGGMYKEVKVQSEMIFCKWSFTTQKAGDNRLTFTLKKVKNVLKT